MLVSIATNSLLNRVFSCVEEARGFWATVDHTVLWQSTAVAVYILIIALMLNWVFSGGKKKLGAIPMTPEERAKYERRLIEDGIEKLIDDLAYAGKISEEAAMKWRKDLGESCKLPGLLPRTVLEHRVNLKAELQRKTFKPRNRLDAVFGRPLKRKYAE